MRLGTCSLLSLYFSPSPLSLSVCLSLPLDLDLILCGFAVHDAGRIIASRIELKELLEDAAGEEYNED